MDFSRDGTLFAVGGFAQGRQGIWMWRVVNGEKVSSETFHRYIETRRLGEVTAIKFAPNGRSIAATSKVGAVDLWDVETGNKLLEFMDQINRNEQGNIDHQLRPHGSDQGVDCVAWSLDSAFIASAGFDATILVWNTATGAQAMEPLRGHSRRVTSVAFDTKMALLASGSDDSTVRVWRLRMGGHATVMHVLRGHTQGVINVALSPDDRQILSACSDGKVVIWTVASGEAVREICVPDRVKDTAWSADGRFVVIATPESMFVCSLDFQVCLCSCFSGVHVSVCVCVVYGSVSDWISGLCVQVRFCESGCLSCVIQSLYATISVKWNCLCGVSIFGWCCCYGYECMCCECLSCECLSCE
jgi:WD40 repeat protein